MPLAARRLAAGLSGLRVTARMVAYGVGCEGSSLCWRRAAMTEPPWVPVAPRTVMILDILEVYWLFLFDNGKGTVCFC